MNDPGIAVRPLETPAEMTEGIEVYRAAFALPPGDPAVSPRLLASLRHNSGSVIGAFASDRMVGFAYGFMGLDPDSGETYHYSQMAAVHPAWQGKGIGRALKQGQREYVASTTVTSIRWAFDPVRSQNAHFNLDVLGAVGRWFVPNMYGIEPYGRDAGLRTDRLVVEWPLTDEPRTRHPVPPVVAWGTELDDGVGVLVGVPSDWAAVAADATAAAELRESVAATLTSVIERGFVAVSCQLAADDAATAVYRLVRA